MPVAFSATGENFSRASLNEVLPVVGDSVRFHVILIDDFSRDRVKSDIEEVRRGTSIEALTADACVNQAYDLLKARKGYVVISSEADRYIRPPVEWDDRRDSIVGYTESILLI